MHPVEADVTKTSIRDSSPLRHRLMSVIFADASARAAGLAAVVGAGVAAVQLRHGIIPLLDTVTYWSGARAIGSGDVFGTTLAPSFSNFDAVEFLSRAGSLPFVDFPVGYPLMAGVLGLLTGTRAAMHILTVFAVAAIAWCIVRGSTRPDSPRRSPGTLIVVTAAASLITCLPAMRLVTQGTLSEPLFIVATLGLVITLARFRAGGSWTPVVALVVIGSLLRFLGAPLALLAGWEYRRRTRSTIRAVLWTGVLMLPAGTNIVGASLAGGGHSAGWRGLDRMDIDVFVRSVGGWFDARQGDIRRTYFTTDGPSWWSWIATLVVIAAMSIALVAVLRGRRAFTDTADLALASAAILTVGLFAGILGFDALVIADNRLMLPAGILVVSAALWTAADRGRVPHQPPAEFDLSVSSPKGPARARTLMLAGTVIVWALTSVRPWNVLERFSDIERPLAISAVARDLDVDVVLSNDADGLHWDTGLPAAYTPMPIKPLTGERVDDAAIYRRLPCPLWRARGAIVISNDATFSTVDLSTLDDLANQGRLVRTTWPDVTVYVASPTACE